MPEFTFLSHKYPKVTPIPGEPYRFHVASSNATEEDYLIDLEARFPMARCTCRHYECSAWPHFKQTLYADHCKHVTAGLVAYALQHIRETSKQLNGEGE
jgi:hypothetical protein